MPLEYICWDDCGRGRDDAVTIRATDHEEAAERYASDANAEGDFVQSRIVFVVDPLGYSTQRFTVEAEMTYVYSAGVGEEVEVEVNDDDFDDDYVDALDYGGDPTGGNRR